jgi:hypothetical protein
MPFITGRHRIVAVTVFIANASVRTVDDDFAALALRDFTRSLSGSLLGGVMRGIAAVALASDGPVWATFNYMLVWHNCIR